MKNILLSLLTVFCLSACSENAPISLKGKNFVLESDKAITLSFDEKEDRFYGKVVNNYMGTYTTEKNNINFGQVASTMMMGPKEEMAKEDKYMRELEKVKTYRYADKKLELKGENVILKYIEK